MTFFDFADKHPVSGTFMVLFLCWVIVEIAISVANAIHGPK